MYKWNISKRNRPVMELRDREGGRETTGKQKRLEGSREGRPGRNRNSQLSFWGQPGRSCVESRRPNRSALSRHWSSFQGLWIAMVGTVWATASHHTTRLPETLVPRRFANVTVRWFSRLGIPAAF